MTAPLPAAHSATITEHGAENVTHPDPDHDGCDFETYLTSDWVSADQSMVGPWKFYWMGAYWNGSLEPV